MSDLFSTRTPFFWVLLANVVIAFALTFLLLTTLIARRPVLPTGIYALGSVLGISGWIVFLGTRVEMLFSPARLLAVPLPAACIALLPHVLLIEAGLLGWLAVPRPWRYLFLLPLAVGALFVCFLLSKAKFHSGP